jgi:hypothetical protein
VTSLSALSSFARATLAALLTFLLVVGGLTLSATTSYADDEPTATSTSEAPAETPAAEPETPAAPEPDPAPPVTEPAPVAAEPTADPAPEALPGEPAPTVPSEAKSARVAALADADADAPTLAVSKTTGINPAGESITITGTNIRTDAAALYGGGKAGIYAQVGYLNEVWKPSESATAGIRSNAYSTWVKESAPSAQYTAWTDNGNGTANFSYTVTIDKATLDAKARDNATLAVFTVGAGGVVQAVNELSVPIAFATPIPAPSLSVSKTTGINPLGEEITITGTNIRTDAAALYGGGKAGIYAQVGYLNEVWKPSESATAGIRSNAYSTWVKESAPSAQYTAWTDNGNGTANFTYTVTIDKATLDAKARENATLAVFTVGAGGVVQAVNELSVPIAFAPAIAAPSLSVSKTTGINPLGEEITITGTNIRTDAAALYGGGKAGIYAQVGYLNEVWKPSESATAGIRSNAYSTWVKESAPSAQYTAWTDNGNGTANFTYTVTIDKATLDAKARDNATLAVFTVGAGGVVQAVNELSVPIAFAPAIAAPSLSVSKTTGINPLGEEITITGTNIRTDAAALYGGGKAGIYAQVGYLNEVWKPSESATAGIRSNAYSTWVKESAPSAQYTAWTDNGNGTANFTYTVTIDKATLDAKARDNATLAVFTVGAGGVVQAVNELSVPIAFAPAIAAPSLSVSKTTGINPAGEEITITGTNIRGGFVNQHGIGEAGVYAQVGWIGADWKPSSVSGGVRASSYSSWVKETAPTEQYTEWAANGDGTANFTWKVTIDKATLDTKKFDGATLAVFTIGAGGVVQAVNELSVPIAFTAPVATETETSLVASKSTGLLAGDRVTLTAGVTPSTAPGTLAITVGSVTIASGPSTDGSLIVRTGALAAGTHVARATFTPTDASAYAASTSSSVSLTVEAATPVAAGSLTWGVKQSLYTYVLGGDGGVSTSQGAGSTGSVVRFPQSTKNFDQSTLTGTSSYSGRVTYSYPGHGFEISLSNPRVSITSSTSGVLFTDVTFNGSTTTGVNLATLALAGASKSGGATTYSNVGVTLTAAGASSFENYYTAGTVMDRMSFVIGAKGVSLAPTAVAAADEEEWEAPATPPATEGISTESTSIEAGSEFTGTATGFQPNEEDVKVVIYSTPTVLATDLVADANGAVSWTGRLPSTLTGEHTLTFQGSVNRGVVLDIAEAVVTTTAATCPVDDAALTWGFKESFRSYISGSIANGEWTVADGATYETPNFGFSGGTGGYDSATGEGIVTFAGSIRFTGHDGALDTTVANPQVRFIDADTAVILLDITGETQDGATVAESGVEFVELDLSAATVTNENGSVSITDAPATLTPAGSAAFGTYDSGEPFDAVTIAFTTPECAAPVVTEEPEAEVETAESGFPAWLLWVLIGLAVVIVAAVVIVVVRRRAAKA